MPLAEARSAALLIIGNEVLSGKVDDTNGPFLIRALRERGIELVELRVVADEVGRIAAAVRELAARADVLITTGGIGPTHDDVTIAAIASAFGVAVVRHPAIEARLRERYGETLSTPRLRLAEVPDGAEVHTSSATPMFVVRLGNVIILPGVPSLMRLCFSQIADLFAQAPFYSRTLFVSVPESEIAVPIAEVQQRHPAVLIGSYPRFDAGPYRVKLTVDGRDGAAVAAAHAELVRALRPEWLVEVNEPM